VLAPTLARTIAADTLVNYSLMYVPQRPVFSHRPMGKLLTRLPRLSLAQLQLTLRSPTECTCRRDLNFLHRPDGRHTFCSLFAGRRCLGLGWLSDHLIVHHQWECSWLCARAHALKSSVLGALLTCPNGLSLFNSDRSSVLPGSSTCQPRLQTSHRPNGEIADTLASTHACTTATDAPVNYRMYVPQRPSMFPISLM
jgi:hypothetical protein